ncbi:hypothetical protein KCU79_g65, partial [Aureobasidium melanogenum]
MIRIGEPVSSSTSPYRFRSQGPVVVPVVEAVVRSTMWLSVTRLSMRSWASCLLIVEDGSDGKEGLEERLSSVENNKHNPSPSYQTVSNNNPVFNFENEPIVRMSDTHGTNREEPGDGPPKMQSQAVAEFYPEHYAATGGRASPRLPHEMDEEALLATAIARFRPLNQPLPPGFDIESLPVPSLPSTQKPPCRMLVLRILLLRTTPLLLHRLLLLLQVLVLLNLLLNVCPANGRAAAETSKALTPLQGSSPTSITTTSAFQCPESSSTIPDAGGETAPTTTRLADSWSRTA